MEDDFVSAEEAARLLGVNVATLYAYVSRKKLRSQQVPGTKAHRYWRADIERIRRRERRPLPVPGELQRESSITLLTDRGPFYRGHAASELAETASLESVAALLWQADESEIFTDRAPRRPSNFVALDRLLAGEISVDRAIAHLPFLEHANPRSYDLSPPGMARSGADILRWLTAIFLRQEEPDTAPIHEQFERVLGLSPTLTGLLRRLLVISADHGFEESTFAVRAVASTGVTPWRCVATGLAVHSGRSSKFGHSFAIRRFVAEIVEAEDPEEPVIRRLREHDEIPGFESRFYENGDPRARFLLDYCEAAMLDHPMYARFRHALACAREINGKDPSLPLVAAFVTATLGMDNEANNASISVGRAPSLISRTVGWIAHASEQYSIGETRHRELLYRGPLPKPR